MKLKVGDKVKLKNRRGKNWNYEGKMDKYIGKIVTISNIMSTIIGVRFEIEEDTKFSKWNFDLDDIEYVVKQKHFKSLPNDYTGTIEIENGIIKEKEILDEAEKRYLKAVIRPFKDKIIYISKEIDFSREYYIYIDLDDDSICLPNFKKGTMYNGMEEDKEYTLKELGLDV
jgi:hypothetical protein|nr:MAG TPA: PROTEIN I, ELECTRON TRANSPORT [Bacteriophage sp.]